MNQNEYLKLVHKVIKNPSDYGIRECGLCGRETIAFVGLCFPDTGSEIHQRLQAPPGKSRSIFYGLCEECMTSSTPEEVSKRIDEKLLKDLNENPEINLLK